MIRSVSSRVSSPGMCMRCEPSCAAIRRPAWSCIRRVKKPLNASSLASRSALKPAASAPQRTSIARSKCPNSTSKSIQFFWPLKRICQSPSTWPPSAIGSRISATVGFRRAAFLDIAPSSLSSTRSREWLSGRVRLEERPGRIHPVDGLGHRAVEVVDEAQDPLLQVFQRAEAGPPQQFPDQDAEPDLYLVQPRAVLGRVHEPDPVAGVAQELCPARL